MRGSGLKSGFQASGVQGSGREPEWTGLIFWFAHKLSCSTKTAREPAPELGATPALKLS